MPLSEFYKMARGDLESTQQKTTTYSADLSHIPDNEIVELVWENGQIMMQGQSSRSRRRTSNNFLSQTPKHRDNDLGTTTNSKMERFGVMDSVLDDFAIAGPSGEMGLGQDDDMGPWWNYPIDDALQHDYSELLTELSGVTVNELSTHNSCSPIGKKNSYNQTIRGSSHSGSSLEQANESQVSSSKVGDSSRSSSGQFYPWSFQESQTSIPSLRSRVPNVNSNNTSSTKHTVCGDSVQAQPSAGGFPSIKVPNRDSGLPNTNSGFMNFSHFSKPVALVRANLQNADAAFTQGTSGLERMGDKNKGTNPSNNLSKATLVALDSGLRKELGSHSQSNLVPPKADSKLLELHAAEQSAAVCREDAVKNDKLPNQVLGASASKGIPDRGKTIEPLVAASSASSANSAERASNDPTHNLKRKFQEADDSDSRSEDVEEDSVGVRKAAPARRGTSSKRSRAAEVHNLSERRRRDRINEKMRALQELIPNCNKVDKASMLDEAIEYLKALQLQVQIMSMGAGLYMPPMMLPTGMQHVHAAHMANFSPMAVGMGMGMGFGMGILDMNGGPPRCPMIQVSPMQGTHYPAQCLPPFSGPTNFQGMVGSNLQVFGHPGQGIPISAPFAHSMPLSGGPPVNSAIQPIANGMTAPVEVPNSAPASNSKDLIQHTDSQMMHNTGASSSMNRKSSQATYEGFEPSTLVLNNDQAPGVGRGEDISLTRENEIRPT